LIARGDLQLLPFVLLSADALLQSPPVVPENSIRQDSRREGESDHHPM
jgi:hypothetical protein